jgi:hypothetical protein
MKKWQKDDEDYYPIDEVVRLYNYYKSEKNFTMSYKVLSEGYERYPTSHRICAHLGSFNYDHSNWT